MNTNDLVFTSKNLHFKEGDVIFNEQDEGEEMYLIDSGEVKIVKTIDDVVVNISYRNLSSGDIFGEMSLITGSRRVASVIAFTDCNLHVMDKEAFMSNIANNWDFVNRILVTLARRLEETDLGVALFSKLISESSKP
jgi:CRP-like cAMP-binding protein